MEITTTNRKNITSRLINILGKVIQPCNKKKSGIIESMNVPRDKAEVSLSSIYGDNMVIQRDSRVLFKGTASAGEKISAVASWGAKADSVTDQNGDWSFNIDTPPAGGPFTMAIHGRNRIELKNILSGDVWLCAGQSNMSMCIKDVNDQDEIYKGHENVQVRIFKTEAAPSPKRLENTNAKWQTCNIETLSEFGAVPYCFGKNLSSELNVPIGLIQSALGGTCIEAWTPLEIQPDDDFLHGLIKRYDSYENKKNCPGYLYNGMIAPLTSFKLKGILWYQGEHNANNRLDRANRYKGQLQRLIDTYRNDWHSPELPFYMVQLPNYGAPGEAFIKDCEWAIVRQAIADTAMSYKNSGMAVIIDLGDARDIHPKNKLEVGRRISSLVLHKTYGIDNIVWTGPTAISCSFEKNSATINFENGGSPISEGKNGLTGFILEDSNGETVKGNARIKDGHTLTVKSDKIKDISAVYYAWAKNPDAPGLFNEAGIPASPFRFLKCNKPE